MLQFLQQEKIYMLQQKTTILMNDILFHYSFNYILINV